MVRFSLRKVRDREPKQHCRPQGGVRKAQARAKRQLRSSRENLHLLSVKPVQILQASSRAKRQLSTINYQLSTINAEGIASCSSAVGEAGADIKELRERSGNYQLPWSACRVATTNRVETKSNRVEVKSNRVESDNFYAIKIFVCAILSFFSDSFDSI